MMRGVLESAFVEGVTDRGNPAVHHVGWRHDIGAGRGVRHRGADQLIDRRIVGDLLIDHDPAVAVIGVFAEAHVSDDEHSGQFVFDGANRRLHRRFGIVGRRTDVVLLLREAEKQHAVDAVLDRRRRFAHRFVDREVEHAGHRRDFTSHAFAFAHKQRKHQHFRRQPRLAHE